MNNTVVNSNTLGRRIVGFILLALLVGVAFLGTGCAKRAAVVNGETVSQAELDERLQARAGAQVLEELINEKLILQEAEKQKIAVGDKEINERLTELKKGFPSEQEFKKNLKDNNMTLAEAKKQLRIQLSMDKLLEKTVEINEKDVKAEYERNKTTIYKGKTISDVRPRIEDELRQRQPGSSSQSLLENLRKKAEIKKY